MSDHPAAPTYVTRRIQARRPDYAAELAVALGEDVVAVVEIDCLRPPMDTLVVTPTRVLAVMYAFVREDGESVVSVPLAEVASLTVTGRGHRLSLTRVDGTTLALGNVVDTVVDLAVVLETARVHPVADPVPEPAPAAEPVSAGIESQLAQLERIAALQAAGGLTEEQADRMRRHVIDEP